jgi:hypothetical protein
VPTTTVINIQKPITHNGCCTVRRPRRANTIPVLLADHD